MKLRHRITFALLAAIFVFLGISLMVQVISFKGWTRSTGEVVAIQGGDEHWFEFEYDVNGEDYSARVEIDTRKTLISDMPRVHLGNRDFYYDKADPSNIRFDTHIVPLILCFILLVMCGAVATGTDAYLDRDKNKKKARVRS